MSEAIVSEFTEQLADLARTFAGRPRDELDALWIIGLEREAIVTVAYRSAVVSDRLGRMPIDDDARAVISRAIRWAWRDEEAHTLWVRGALMRNADLTQRARAIAAQVEGWIGGWVSSRQNHLPWREAPLRRLVAELVETAGVLGGRIPEAVRSTLHWNTFGDFCRFNRAAETTAAMAWRRMAELARTPEVAMDADAEGFAWMATDEERHARIFTVLAEAFDRDDRLVMTAGALRAQLQSVGERFVAVPDRGRRAWNNPLGKGGTVAIREGGDITRVVAGVLEAIGMDTVLAAHLPADRPLVVALKTTFMLIADRTDRSPGVSVAVLRAVTGWLRARGAVVHVIDARNIYDVFHAHRTVAEVAAYLGLGEPVIDAQIDQVPYAYPRGGAIGTIARTWRDADVRVLLGKLRSHPTATALLSLEASEGLATRHDDHLFIERRADRETAMLMTLDALPPHAALLDAWEDVPDGLLGVIGTDRPLHPRRIYGSTDAVALDAVAGRHLSAMLDDPLLEQAFDWFGDPRPATTIDGTDTPIAGFRLPAHSERTAILSALALPVFTHASMRGALFLPAFDESAFPAIAEPPVALRLARAAVRKLVTDRAPFAHRAEGLLPTFMLDGVRISRIGAGPPIVLLHGYPDTLQIWSRVAPRLAARHEVIAFDWPGLGASLPRPGAAGPDELADQLLTILDALGLARVDLVGADMGAPPALVFAARHPERTASVVVMSSLLFGDDVTSMEISVMRRTGLAAAAFRFAPSLVYARCKQTFLPAGETLPDAIDADFAAAFHQPAVRRHLARMCADYERALPGLSGRYWTIRSPVHLLWAEHDGHFPPHQARRLCELLPEARLIVVPSARHWMALSRAPEIADHILAMIERPGS